MGSKLDFPLVVSDYDGKPKALRCFCGVAAVEMVEDPEFGDFPACRVHADESEAVTAGEHGTTVRGAA
jgi:hypothetical protein